MFLVEGLLITYLGLAVVYSLIFSIAGHLYRLKQTRSNSAPKKIAVLVPGYKEDNVIISVALKLTSLQYPKDCFDIIIIADSFETETIKELNKLPIKLIIVNFEKRSKANSLNYAVQTLSKEYEVAIVLDADNITESDFLLRINAAMSSGIKVAQAHRVAKNTNTSFAVLDACSEAVNNHIFRKGPNALGLSASLIGSGIAFDYSLFKNLLPACKSVYEDREIQFELAKRVIKIDFLEDVLVFDEKIDQASNFQNQRRRWLYAQVHTLYTYFFQGHAMLFKGNFNFYNLAVLNNLFPPRLVTLISLLFFAILFTLLPGHHIYAWWSLFILFVFALAIALPRKLYNKDLLRAMFSIPDAFFNMVKAFFKMRGASKFIHTTHSKVDVDSVFKKNESR